MKLIIPAEDLGSAIMIRNGKGANGTSIEINVAQAAEAAAKLREIAAQVEALQPARPL